VVAPWAVLVGGVLVLFWLLRWRAIVAPTWVSVTLADLWSAAWPIAIAGVVAAAILMLKPVERQLSRIAVPAGDVVVPLAWILKNMNRTLDAVVVKPLTKATNWLHGSEQPTRGAAWTTGFERLTAAVERNWMAVGIAIGLAAAALLLLLIF
jgi:hypothetical protein